MRHKKSHGVSESYEKGDPRSKTKFGKQNGVAAWIQGAFKGFSTGEEWDEAKTG